MSSKDKHPPEEADPFYSLSRFASKPSASPHISESDHLLSLRQKAEAHFREREAGSSEQLDGVSQESLRTILHELRVHQIELEMQNEELRTAQGKLDAARSHYFELYDLAPVGYITVSETGLILEANLTATALLGVGQPTLVKQPFSRFILKEDQDIFYLLKMEPRETFSPTCDLRMLKPDGTAFWAHLKIVSARDENGEPLCRIVLSDISWRKQAEEDVQSLNAELRANEERLHELNALGELLLLPDSIEKKFKLITDTVVRVFGADFARIWIIKPGDRCNSGCVHAQAAEGPHVCRFRDKCLHLLASSGRYTHTDGGAHARVPFGCYKIGKIATGEESGFLTNEVTTDPRVHDHAWAKELSLKAFAGYCLTDAANTPAGVMALFSKQAISKHQDLLLRGFAHLAGLTLIAARSEEALRRNEIAVEQSGDGIAIADMEGTLVFLNAAWARLHGYEPTEMIGQPLSINHTPEQMEREVIPFNDTVREKGSHMGEQGHRRKDGTTFPAWMSVTDFKDSNGKSGGILAIAHDITERKQAEEEILRINRQLAEATAKAEKATAAKSEFLATMSHELRNPLNGILGFAEILAETPLNDEQQSYTESLRDSGIHLLALVNDVLDLSSIENGALALHAAPCDLAHLVRLSSELIRKSAADKGVAFHCNVAADVPEQITGDERRIRQILVNLLANAVKFTSDGSVSLGVTRSGEFLEFSVEDTGLGISSEALSRLFQLFTQADETINKKYGGTGIGLAVSQRLAEAMGGRISVVSAPGKGSTFTFRLPLEIPASSSKPAPPAACDRNSAQPSGALVLVVEDDRTSAVLAGKLLQNLGYRAEFATNGAEAVKAFSPGKFSAILMDMAMPVMDGLETTRNIREIEAPAGCHVPIIALTANVMPGDRERCLAAGMDDFLRKPFKKDELAAKLAWWQSRSSCDASASTERPVGGEDNIQRLK
ncbi:MAG: PAS domain S-box protein [Verrucomicrobiaceae bacterium]|nr:MAG: PAS domain S-box protein [Verrucomicrobiaceae bacterium]